MDMLWLCLVNEISKVFMPDVLKNHLLMNTFTEISTKNCNNKLQKQNYFFLIFTSKYHRHKNIHAECPENHSLMNTFTKISTGICTKKLQKQISFKIFTVKHHWHKDCLVYYWSPKIIHFPLPPNKFWKQDS